MSGGGSAVAQRYDGVLSAGQYLTFGTTLVTIADSAVTLTAAQTINTYIQQTPTAARAVTTPTAALLLTALGSQVKNGDCFWCIIDNQAGGANTITFTAGTKVSIVNTATIAQNNSKIFLGQVIDATGAATPSITFYSIGTLTH